MWEEILCNTQKQWDEMLNGRFCVFGSTKNVQKKMSECVVFLHWAFHTLERIRGLCDGTSLSHAKATL